MSELGKKVKDEKRIQKLKGRKLLTGTAASPGIVLGFIRNIGACPINPSSEAGAARGPASKNQFVGQAHR